MATIGHILASYEQIETVMPPLLPMPPLPPVGLPPGVPPIPGGQPMPGIPPLSGAKPQRQRPTRVGRILRGAARIVGAGVSKLFPDVTSFLAGATPGLHAAAGRDLAELTGRAEVIDRIIEGRNGQFQQRYAAAYGLHGIMAFVSRHFLVIVVLVVLIFVLPRKKKVVRGRNVNRVRAIQRPRVRRRVPEGVSPSLTPKKAPKRPQKGFARRINGRLYTDPKKWGAAMRSLRKKKK